MPVLQKSISRHSNIVVVLVQVNVDNSITAGEEKRKIRKLALVGIIPNQILFSFSSEKDRRTDSRTRRKNTAQPRREERKIVASLCKGPGLSSESENTPLLY